MDAASNSRVIDVEFQVPHWDDALSFEQEVHTRWCGGADARAGVRRRLPGHLPDDGGQARGDGAQRRAHTKEIAEVEATRTSHPNLFVQFNACRTKRFPVGPFGPVNLGNVEISSLETSSLEHGPIEQHTTNDNHLAVPVQI